MTAVSALSEEQQENYKEVKQTLLSTYQVSAEIIGGRSLNSRLTKITLMLGFEHTGRVIPNGWTPRTKQHSKQY